MENKNVSSSDAVIRVRGLKKDFDNLSVLKGIDVDIHKGDVVCVIGASGSGKSTFLRCLNLLEQPTGGSIEFDSVNLTSETVNLDQHRQKMGMVFQQFNLFPHLTVLDNLTLAPVMLKKLSKPELSAPAHIPDPKGKKENIKDHIINYSDQRAMAAKQFC